ncbi:MAG: transcription antitermination factor NusB [Candidatus Omnitrophica bacterium]|nr:transcription antitermination factor NusB [Candidatus Omnitrophota bacterium]
MRKRTLARECALKILYQVDITGSGFEKAKEEFCSVFNEEWDNEEVKDYSTMLVEGVIENTARIDKEISAHATNWQLKRMAVVDRNILRLGCFELLFRDDIPPKVAINEAVDLAKRYSSNEAGKFVNGVLDKIKSDKEKA